MSARFFCWKDAHAAAVNDSRRFGMDIAIRVVKEYGKPGWNVSIACRNDSDYTLAEIVRPADSR